MSRKYVIGWDKENVSLQETTKHIIDLRDHRKDSNEPIYQMEHVYYVRKDSKMLMSLDETWNLTYKDVLPDHVKALLYLHDVL